MNRYLPMFNGIAAGALLIGLLGSPAYAQQTNGAGAGNSKGQGSVNIYGQTNENINGMIETDKYIHTWYCDTSVPSKASTGCEAGVKFNKPPSNMFDPLYITVPDGFTEPPMLEQCPQGLQCVDHPPTIDLSGIGLPPNGPLPGHDHFVTTDNAGVPEYWDVFVVLVTNRQTYDDIEAHHSAQYIEMLLKQKNPYVMPPLPTNVFLFFATVPLGK